MQKKVEINILNISMIKKIILLSTLFTFLFFVPKITFGQIISIADNVPGLSCGVANDLSGKDKCCNTPKIVNCDSNQIVDLALGLLKIIPGTNFIFDFKNDLTDKCLIVKAYVDNNNEPQACMSGEAMVGGQVTTDYANSNCKCIDTKAKNPNQAMLDMCSKYLTSSINANELSNCFNCANSNGIWTGLGCLPLEIDRLIGNFVLTMGIGVGGGFALLCIIYAAFMMQSSQGNPEKLKKAQEMITSCIMGLMLIIFSVFIMRIIGVNIIRIPGFQ